MLSLLIDTCVWLDIVKDPEQQKILRILEQLIEMEEVSLIIPRTILNEFANNKDRVIKDSTKSLSTIVKRAKQVVSTLASRDKDLVLDHLDDIIHKIPSMGDSAVNSVEYIEKLFSNSKIINQSSSIKLRASHRAINKLAPFHKNKNSFNDALIIESYAECLRKVNPNTQEYAFVTHNTSDFSKPQADNKEHHPDFDSIFEPSWSNYSINLAETISKVDPDLITELMIEQEEWEESPRELSEIIATISELIDKVWYNRHQNWLYQIETGERSIVETTTADSYNNNETPLHIYNGARRAAKSMERKYGVKNLGPWDDFEWGMLNGKLSALRWVLGDEWDMLDT